VTLTERFDLAVTQASREQTWSPELFVDGALPDGRRRPAGRGAGLSMLSDLHIPLGARDEVVAGAERLQTTLGGGREVSSKLTLPAGLVGPTLGSQVRLD